MDVAIKGELKKEIEGMIMAPQSQSPRTNAVKARIDKAEKMPNGGCCNEKEETIHDTVSGCSCLA